VRARLVPSRLGFASRLQLRRLAHERAESGAGEAETWARLGSNQQPLVCETSALPLELLARVLDPGQGVEPRSPRSERGVLPVRRSRNAAWTARQKQRLSVHPPSDGRSTQQASATCRALVACSVTSGRGPNDVFHATRLPFDPGSPATGLRMCAVVAVLRGGALEPEPHGCSWKTAS
jgi:hypothetical protein